MRPSASEGLPAKAPVAVNRPASRPSNTARFNPFAFGLQASRAFGYFWGKGSWWGGGCLAGWCGYFSGLGSSGSIGHTTPGGCARFQHSRGLSFGFGVPVDEPVEGATVDAGEFVPGLFGGCGWRSIGNCSFLARG